MSDAAMGRWAAIFVTVLLTALLAPRRGGASDTDLLVWLHTPRGNESYRLVAARRFAPEPRGLGIEVAVDGRVLRVRHVEERARRWVCGAVDMVPASHGQEVRGFRLEVVDPGHATRLISESGIEHMDEVQNRSTVLATVGPYAALRTRWSYYAPCSAHGFFTLGWHWVDLRTAEVVPGTHEMPVADVEARAAHDRLERSWRAVLGPRDGAAADPADHFLHGLTAYPKGEMPVLAHGRWLARPVLASSPGDALGEHFTRTAPVELPAPFAAYVDVPPEVTRFVASVPGATLGGFSRL